MKLECDQSRSSFAFGSILCLYGTASTGDGCIAVGSEDGKIRLYSDKSMRQVRPDIF